MTTIIVKNFISCSACIRLILSAITTIKYINNNFGMENCNKTIKPSEKLTVPAKIDIKSKIIPINIINKRILYFV